MFIFLCICAYLCIFVCMCIFKVIYYLKKYECYKINCNELCISYNPRGVANNKRYFTLCYFTCTLQVL